MISGRMTQKNTTTNSINLDARSKLCLVILFLIQNIVGADTDTLSW